MKKYKGFTCVELVVAISILAVVMSLSIVKLNSYGLTFDATVVKLKTDIRRIIAKAEDDYHSYSVSFYKGYYTIGRDNKRLSKIILDEHTYVLGSGKLEFRGIKRMGAPGRGGSIYVFNDITKKLERITYMPASGRVTSYEDNYYTKKDIIDGKISRLR